MSARLLLWFVALIALSAGDGAQGETASEQTAGAPNVAQRVLQFDLFVRSDSELCDTAASLAAKFCKTRDGIALVVHDVAVDRSALEQYRKLMSAYRVRQPVLPAFYACHRLKVGYTEQEGAAKIAELFAIHAYIRPGCQHCRDASTFLRALTKRWQGMRVVFHDVINKPSARTEMLELARRHGVSAASLPGIVLCGRYISGYDRDATTGRQIEELLRSAAVGHPPDSSIDGVTHLDRGVQRLTFVSLNLGAPSRELTTVVAVAADAREDLPPANEGSSSEEQIPSLPPVGGNDEI